jgi:hypothetical protein
MDEVMDSALDRHSAVREAELGGASESGESTATSPGTTGRAGPDLPSPAVGWWSRAMTAIGAHPDGGRRVVISTVALAPTLLLIGYWACVGRNDRMSILEDDAFYYFGVARNIAEGHGSTFAGSVATNGYHPLWLLVLVPITALVQDPDRLVLAVLVLHGVLWAASVREIFRIGRSIGTWHCAAGAIAAYAVLTVMTGHLSFNGMESALVLYLFLVLIRVGVSLGDDRRPRDDLKIGLLLALICLARLDAVFAAVPVGAVLLASGRPRGGALLRRAAALAVPTTVALSGYVTLNLALFDTPTPVSGRMKGLGAPGDNTEQLWGALKIGRFIDHNLWFGVAALVLVGLALATGQWWRTDGPRRRLMGMTVALVVGEVILVAYLVRATAFVFFFSWYHYQIALFALGGGAIVLSWAIRRFGRPAQLACVVLALATVAGAALEVVIRAREQKRVAAFAAADYVSEELPANAVIAMGDRAGYFGYLADRPLLHLEGLVADADFLDQVESGGALERMSEEGVDYYVHNSREGWPVLVDWRPCWRFVEPPYTLGHTFQVTVCEADLVLTLPDPEGKSDLTIWRFRPELNTGR